MCSGADDSISKATDDPVRARIEAQVAELKAQFAAELAKKDAQLDDFD